MEDEPLTLKLRSIFDTAPGWFQDWYFELRLSEETYRATRYKSRLTLCLIRLKPTLDIDNEGGIQLLTRLTGQFRRTDLAGITRPNELGICLIEATKDQATVVMERLVPLLDCHLAGLGLAAFPSDATTAEGLLHHARTTID
jgi:hypothetical protein